VSSELQQRVDVLLRATLSQKIAIEKYAKFLRAVSGQYTDTDLTIDQSISRGFL